jgi:hypothetical protein
MNRKLATLLFAIGIGVTAVPAMASCIHYCAVSYAACIKAGKPMEQCDAAQAACEDACGCQEECCNEGECSAG